MSIRGFFCTVMTAAFFVSPCAYSAAPDLSGSLPDKSAAPLSANPSKPAEEYYESYLTSALNSLYAGMPSLAQNILEEALSKDSIPQKYETALRKTYVDSLIAQGNYELAQKQNSLLGASSDPRNKIRSALVFAGLNRPADAAAALENLDAAKLSKEDNAWYRLALGYVYYEQGRPSDALRELAEAKKSAPNSYVLSDIEIAMNMCRLTEGFEGRDLNEMERDLSEKVVTYMGTPAGFQFAKQYAVVLFKLGRPAEAAEVIDQQLQIQLAQEIDKDELRLLSAAMTKDPEKQYVLLRDILKSTSSAGAAEFAISLLSRNPDTRPEELKKFLNDLLENGSIKIRDRILLEAAKLDVKERNRAAASAAANRIVEEFPASKYKPDALRILAWAAFGKEPEYRLAASYLTALAELEKDPRKALQTKMLAADCYFLNKDYATAAKFYRELFDKMTDKRGTLLNKAVDALAAQNDTASAIKLLDHAYSVGGISDDEFWNAEWKLISKYKAAGDNRKALERINRAIISTGKAAELLRLRMLWLRARITEESQDFPKTVELCGSILDDIRRSQSPDAKTLEVIGASTILLKARCLERMSKLDGADGAYAAYELLRKTYPTSAAAQLSYLYQARSEAARGRFVAAQQLCRSLADAFPRGEHTYSALFDAAMYARQVGLEENYRTALSTLDKLCSDFPDDGRNFYARLAQAEILRLINAFADARKLYNEIINKYQSHPEIHLAWLGLADATLAQQTRSMDAAAIYERLYSLPEMPVSAKAEAAFKWGFALERADRGREANEVWWLTSNNLLNSSALSTTARYWIGRSLYSLAKSLETDGHARDARAAYELIVKYGLPSSPMAKQKLSNTPAK